MAVNLGAAPRDRGRDVASARIAASRLPYLPGSTIPLTVDGLVQPFLLEVVGTGWIADGMLNLPASPAGSSATVVASDRDRLAVREFQYARPPHRTTSFLAVASYDAGVVIHDRATFEARSVLGVGGAPSDVAVDSDGRIAAGNTAGDTMVVARMDPWRVASITGVVLSDEIAFDAASHALFVTDRDVSGSGALTRVAADGTVTRRILGLTSEGIAVDAARHRVYVANANDGTISIVDAESMAELRRFRAVDRAFSLALSSNGKRLYVVSNQSISSMFAQAGSVVAFDVSRQIPHRVARSGPLAFPLGVALDQTTNSVFVTDERDDDVYVLNPRTLRAKRLPLKTCRTPWKPAFDAVDARLYVPCAQADEVDVFDTRSMRRVSGAPFSTGGYPLSVAIWHATKGVVR